MLFLRNTDCLQLFVSLDMQPVAAAREKTAPFWAGVPTALRSSFVSSHWHLGAGLLLSDEF